MGTSLGEEGEGGAECAARISSSSARRPSRRRRCRRCFGITARSITGRLRERRDAYRHGSKTSIRYGDQSAQLKEIRAFDPERQGRWSFSSQQATLRRLDKAFAAFFRRVKAGEKPGYPRFRGVNWFDTA